MAICTAAAAALQLFACGSAMASGSAGASGSAVASGSAIASGSAGASGSAVASGAAMASGSETARTNPSGACIDRRLATRVVEELGRVFRTQSPDGAFTTPPALAFYDDHPVHATLAIHAVRVAPAPAFLSQAAASISRHTRYLFQTFDTNGNLLIERPVIEPDGTVVTLEDPAYNAMLALDMASLAALYVELRKPMRALYWYEGARSLQRALIRASFDPDFGYFFPVEPGTATPHHRYDALGAMPALFSGLIGHNRAASIGAIYLKRGRARAPQDPADFLDDVALSRMPGNPGGSPATLLRSAVLVDVLAAAGLSDERATARERLLRFLDRNSATGHAGNRVNANRAGTRNNPAGGAERGANGSREAPRAPGATAFLRAHIRCGRGLYDNNISLRILEAIAQSRHRLDDGERVQLTRAFEGVLDAAGALEPPVADAEALERNVRDAFRLVSRLRKNSDDAAFFNRQDRYELSGSPPAPAFERLLDDAAGVIRRAENRVFAARHGADGLHIRATLRRERTVPGERVEVAWAFESGGQRVELDRIEVHAEGRVDTLAGNVKITPGTGALRKTTQLRLDGAAVPSLAVVRATVVIVDARGRRTRRHIDRSVWVEPAVEVVMRFPQGRKLAGSTVPLDVQIVRHTRARAIVQCGWYSPAGLRLREGALTEVPVDQDTLTVRYDVTVPQPCRPGPFPFRMKFVVDGVDAGTIQSALYRPFEWIGVGPFPAGKQPLETQFAPERDIDLYRGYAGVGRRITWRALGPGATSNDGNVHPGSLLRDGGVACIYTVIRSAYAVEVPIALVSDGQATLFVNGRRVIRRARRPGEAPRRERVLLKAGLNDILVKVVGDARATFRFDLGDDRGLAPDEFNNNLWELIDGYQTFVDRGILADGGNADSRRTITLRFDDRSANSVSVVGSFNGWSPDQSPMRRGPDRTWEIQISLLPGRYTYRFLVNNRRQVLDPDAALTEPDGFGGRNSVIVVEP